MLDKNNDGEVTEYEFLEACMEDQYISETLSSKLGVENGVKKTAEEEIYPYELPRLSKSAETRGNTKRRYSDICTRLSL